MCAVPIDQQKKKTRVVVKQKNPHNLCSNRIPFWAYTQTHSLTSDTASETQRKRARVCVLRM